MNSAAPTLLAVLMLTQMYTTADPVDPTKLGLATPYSRYMIQPDWSDGSVCNGLIRADQNVVMIGAIEADPGTYGILPAGMEDDGSVCLIRLVQRMSETPCFMIADVCDVRAETDE